jgi:hypothetical protein
MSLKLVGLADAVEQSDAFHLARLILLLKACGGRSGKPIQGIMKLAKLDFLLRYPNCLTRVIKALGRDIDSLAIPETERNTIETKMIRFRYGPWDKRYRRWIGLLVSKRLAQTYLDGKTVNVQLTPAGVEIAKRLSQLNEFHPLLRRSQLIAASVGTYSATKLKDFIYKVFPEIVTMEWGEHIEL